MLHLYTLVYSHREQIADRSGPSEKAGVEEKGREAVADVYKYRAVTWRCGWRMTDPTARCFGPALLLLPVYAAL